MSKLQFSKYTCCGNNFVIVDELDGTVVDDGRWWDLASQFASQYFGIGCDNVLVIQRACEATLARINDARGYWDIPPEVGDVDMVFRMFEPDGAEAFCCGNGLMSIAEYLRQHRGIEEARILTEIPLTTPRVLNIGSVPRMGRSWVTLGEPRRMPEVLVDRGALERLDHGIDRIDRLTIQLREHDLSPISDAVELSFEAYLVFTGEPHLVIFPEDGFAPHDVGGTFFSSSVPNVTDTSGVCRRVNFGTGVLRRLGYYLNHKHRDLFPQGINVNVGRIDEENRVIEYRTFERGIERETLACGTGALAVTYAVWALGLLGGESFTVQPHRCRWYEPDQTIGVTRHEQQGWTLDAAPRLICDGEFIAASVSPAVVRDGDLAASSAEAESADSLDSPIRESAA